MPNGPDGVGRVRFGRREPSPEAGPYRFLLDAPSRGANSAEGCFPRASAIFAIVSTPTELRAVRRKCIVGREIPDRSESLLRLTPS